MKFAADFHIHSKYSRATSKQMDLENLDMWAGIKGIKVMGTGDFTHPAWIKSLKSSLKPAETGLFALKGNGYARFMLTSEISCIYSKGGKVRKVHMVLMAPSFEAVDKIIKKLEQIGNLSADGRPILGLDAQDLLKIALDADNSCMVVPAHIWTPWFAVFGSKSGFNSLQECFEDNTKYVYAVETGLSSDPQMNWRLSQLDSVSIISNSDSHSPQKIGREANIFDTDLSYGAICQALKEKDKTKFLYTIEFFPEEGKYHYDGHSLCHISFSPKESAKHHNMCPVCGKPLVIGVLNRVEELADRPEDYVPKNAIPFKRLIPLQEIIADAMAVPSISKQVMANYHSLINSLGSEFDILLEKSFDEISSVSSHAVAEGVIRVREGKVFIEPGYDGVYGKIKIFSDEEKGKVKKRPAGQKSLF